MHTKGKAGTGVTVTDLGNHSIAGGNRKSFSASNYRQSRFASQCLGCKSDYMKFSHSGYCQDCQQRVEFIRRERPEVVAKLQNKFQEVAV
jgi:hypothetical protein